MSTAGPEMANPRGLGGPLVPACGLLTALGLVAFVAGLLTDPQTAWRAYHANFLYYATLSQGALVLACAFVIIGARWPGPVRHVAAGLAAWVPISFVLALVAYFGRETIFAAWIHGAPPGKEVWLRYERVFLTDLAILFVLTLLTLSFIRNSFRPALKSEADRAAATAGRMFQAWTAGWKGDEQERAACEKRLKVLAPIICLLYAFGYTVVGYDQVMSLTPTWYSNIFGWYFGWGGFLSGIAATALICVLLRRNSDWQPEITPARMHDLGKMIFAFSIFWMYLFFSQYIVIWYGNLPEETQFLEARLGSQFLQDTWYFALSRFDEPYVKLSMSAWVGCWIVPFWVLLGQRPKRTPAILGTVAAIVLLGFWLERNALVWPSFVPDDGNAWLGAIQLGVAAGFFGAFALVYLVFSRVFPTLPLPRRS